MPSQNFGFPFSNPYPTQLELLKDVYDSIDQRKIGFFESPTGTGKTLSLLCGALSWLEDSQLPVKTTRSQIDDASSEPEWLKNIRTKTTEELSIHSEITFNHPKKPKISSSANVDQSILNLVKMIDDNGPEENSYDADLRSRNFGLKTFRPKIIYCSRTHSQLTQVVNELKKTSFFRNSNGDTFLNLAVVTASRNSLCINKDLKKEHTSSSALNEACNELIRTEDGCQFFNKHKDEAFKEHLEIISSKRIVDIEDLLNSGISSHCCPYYTDRYLVQPAAFVATPYNSILDKNTREAYGIELEDNIVIFDEAHNIVDFIKQMNSVNITDPIEFFDLVLKCIDEYLRKYSKRLSGSNLSSLSQLRIFFFKISEFVKQKNYNSLSVNDFIYASQIDSINFSRLVIHIEETKLFTKVFNDDLKREISIINSLIKALETGDCNGRFIHTSSELKYICTNVVDLMSEIIEKCRSVIFCGGTMSPLNDTIKQLLNPFLQDLVKSKSIGHVISSENINLSILASGPSGTSFNFSFESRNNPKMIQELGIMIANYSRIIPAGLVVFFTSFAYMDQISGIWESKNITNQISSAKKIFWEKKGVSSDILLSEYEEAINSNQGAVIFAVMGGKLSEGINFNDNLGRGVITVGLPYPNIHDAEVKEQISAYVSLMRKSDSERSVKQLESDYLENSCMIILNQTIGRVIRHKNDFAAIIMIDERMNRETIIDRLPKWIIPSLLDRGGKFDSSFRSVSQVFFKSQIRVHYIIFSFSRNGIPWFPIAMLLQPLRRQAKSALKFKRVYSSASNHDHSESGLHFENHRVEDAMPFNYDNKFTFALKLGAFSALGLAIPVIGVWWNM